MVRGGKTRDQGKERRKEVKRVEVKTRENRRKEGWTNRGTKKKKGGDEGRTNGRKEGWMEGEKNRRKGPVKTESV